MATIKDTRLLGLLFLTLGVAVVIITALFFTPSLTTSVYESPSPSPSEAPAKFVCSCGCITNDDVLLCVNDPTKHQCDTMFEFETSSEKECKQNEGRRCFGYNKSGARETGKLIGCELTATGS